MAVKEMPPQGLVRKVVGAAIFIGLLSFIILLSVASVYWNLYGYQLALSKVARIGHQERQLLTHFGAFSLFPNGSQLQLENSWMSQAANTVQNTTSQLNAQLNQQFPMMDFATDYPLASEEAHELITTLQRALNLAGACIGVLYVKLLMCLAALPLLILTGVSGVIDGLNQRAIRTACLGRESTYVFHKTIPITRTLLVVILIMWFSSPLTLNPTLFFLVLSVVVALVMSLSASRFKKYL